MGWGDPRNGFMVRWVYDALLKKEGLCVPFSPNIWCATNSVFKWTAWLPAYTINTVRYVCHDSRVLIPDRLDTGYHCPDSCARYSILHGLLYQTQPRSQSTTRRQPASNRPLHLLTLLHPIDAQLGTGGARGPSSTIKPYELYEGREG